MNIKKYLHILVPILLFIGTYLIYKNSYPEPRIWLDHYLYLAKSIMNGVVTVNDIPEFYQDVNLFNSHKYLPFAPLPAVILIPFILINSATTEQFVSIIIGSINVGLIYLLLKKLTSTKNAVLLSVFLGFGTVHFWASLVGTAWYFAHIVAFMLMVLSLILSVKNTSNTKALISGIFFALAGLSRLTLITGGLFFVINYWKDKKNLIYFLVGSFIFVPIFFYYNFLRFGNIFETGYIQIYNNYTNGYVYSIQRVWHPESPEPKYMDIKSIPYHLYTLFIMPPEVDDLNISRAKPSPFGIGIIFISPLLLLVFNKIKLTKIEVQSWFGAIPVAFLTFCHYAQGWVQFGYRFLLDFLPFLLIILAVKFRPTKFNILLLVFSIVINYWGVNWAIKSGW